MEHFLYRLKFTTALHMGKDTGAGSLDDCRMNIHADTIFAALCCEAARGGKAAGLAELFACGALTISDALPYAGDELFLPRPVLYVENTRRAGDASLKKALKGVEYIPLSLFEEYLQGLRRLQPDIERFKQKFGRMVVGTRVALKGNSQPLPYHVAAWKFAAGCGLYLVVRTAHEEARRTFAALLARLGLSGVGGKQSSGWGKFDVTQSAVPAPLMKLITDSRASYQMLLGTALPADSELDDMLADSWYSLVRRGGFIRSDNYAPGQLKKRTIYMLAPGSCLRQRFQGGMYDLSDGGAHPVWRCGSTLFAGVNL